MTNSNEKQYFDLHTHGLGYLNRVTEVTPKEGDPFLSASIAALRGPVDNAEKTHFEVRVTGKKAQEIVRLAQPAVEGNLKVLVGFTLSDVKGETFTYQKGKKAGQTGVCLKAQLISLKWVRVEGQPFYCAKDDAAEAA